MGGGSQPGGWPERHRYANGELTTTLTQATSKLANGILTTEVAIPGILQGISAECSQTGRRSPIMPVRCLRMSPKASPMPWVITRPSSCRLEGRPHGSGARLCAG